MADGGVGVRVEPVQAGAGVTRALGALYTYNFKYKYILLLKALSRIRNKLSDLIRSTELKKMCKKGRFHKNCMLHKRYLWVLSCEFAIDL